MACECGAKLMSVLLAFASDSVFKNALLWFGGGHSADNDMPLFYHPNTCLHQLTQATETVEIQIR